jgi:hypothetical protein
MRANEHEIAERSTSAMLRAETSYLGGAVMIEERRLPDLVLTLEQGAARAHLKLGAGERATSASRSPR